MAAVKVWNDTTWVDHTAGVKRWNGTTWVSDTFKYRTAGGAWVEITPPAAGITFVGADSEAGSFTSLNNITWPGVAANDVAYLGWTFDRAVTPSTDPPSGWAPLGSAQGTGSTQPGTRLFRRVCTGSESGAIVLTLPTIQRHAACLVVYRGVNATTPEDVTVTVDNSHTAQPAHNPPPITTVTADTAVVTFILERASNADTGFTPPTGYTERADTAAGGFGNGGAIAAVADQLTPHAAGTITPGDWTGDNATGFSQIVTYTIALRPA